MQDESPEQRKQRRALGLSHGAQKLRTWLFDNNISLRELAGRVGVTHVTVSNWKNGNDMPEARNAVLLEAATSYGKEHAWVVTEPVRTLDWVDPSDEADVRGLREMGERVRLSARADRHFARLMELTKARDEYREKRDGEAPGSEGYRTMEGVAQHLHDLAMKEVEAIDVIREYFHAPESGSD